MICGVEVAQDSVRCMADWELLKLLNLNSPFSLRSANVTEVAQHSSLDNRMDVVAAAAKTHTLATGTQLRQLDVDFVCCLVPFIEVSLPKVADDESQA